MVALAIKGRLGAEGLWKLPRGVPRQNLVQPIGCPLDSHWHGRLGAGQQR